jgi:hypothetical protein
MKLALPPILLRIEGAVLLALSVLLYDLNGASWLLFVLLFLAPDLSMLGYLSEPRTGAISYNLFHTYVLPGLLAAFGFDRMVGYGLKYPTGFFDTHLNRP